MSSLPKASDSSLQVLVTIPSVPGRNGFDCGSLSGDSEKPWSAIVPDLSPLPKLWRYTLPLALGLFLFAVNNLAPIAAFSHPRAGYVPLFMPRNQDSAQYLTWIEGYKNTWTIPDYNAPWQTEAALHVPLMWIPARLSALTGISPTYAYLALQGASYILGAYALAFFLRVFAVGFGQSVLAVAVMIFAVPMKSLGLIPALLLKPNAWALLHTGYEDFLGGTASEGLFQGISCGASITFGAAGALLSLALLGRYLRFGRKYDLWAASLVVALSGFLHPFEFIPVTAAAIFALIWTRRKDEQSIFKSVISKFVINDLLILGVPAFGVVLFYFLPTLTHPWLKVATKLNSFHGVHIWAGEILGFGPPVFLALALAFWKPKLGTSADFLLACFVVMAFVGYHMPILPWPQHFKDGMDYAAAILVVRKLDQLPGLMRLWASRTQLRIAFVLLLVAAGLAPHIYFRYLTYRAGITATKPSQNTAVAPLDEVEAISWLRAHAASTQLILAPLENAPWMATVPMHSFASHWIFSLTDQQQTLLADAFFQGTLSDAESNALLKTYGVRYVLVPVGSPALQYMHDAEFRWTGQSLRLYEFPDNQMQPFPKLQQVSPTNYVWNPTLATALSY